MHQPTKDPDSSASPFPFADQVSHQFRTPLTVIKEYATIMRDGLLGEVNERQRGVLDVIHDRTDDLAALVDDMLHMSKLETGTLGTWRREISAGDLLEAIRPTLQRKAEIKKVSLRWETDPDLGTVHGDFDQLARALSNLASSILQNSEIGDRVTIWAKGNQEETEKIEFGITHVGEEPAGEYLAMVFDYFRPAEADEDIPPRRLGLRVARDLIELHYSRIEVRDAPGEGITLAFDLAAWNPLTWTSRYLDWLARRFTKPIRLALAQAITAYPPSPGVSNVVDEFLQQAFGGDRLAQRIQPGRWLLFIPGESRTAEALFETVRAAWDHDHRGFGDAEMPGLGFRILEAEFFASQQETILKRVRKSLEESSPEPALPSVC